jgi:hypothetical protein
MRSCTAPPDAALGCARRALATLRERSRSRTAAARSSASVTSRLLFVAFASSTGAATRTSAVEGTRRSLSASLSSTAASAGCVCLTMERRGYLCGLRCL